jgi:hypothetical protein
MVYTGLKNLAAVLQDELVVRVKATTTPSALAVVYTAPPVLPKSTRKVKPGTEGLLGNFSAAAIRSRN